MKFAQINNYIKMIAIRRAFRHPAPNIIPMSGDQMRDRNYYSVCLGENSDRWKFLVQDCGPRGVSGLWFEASGTEGAPASIPKDYFAFYQLNINYYLREIGRDYHSALEFLAHQITFYPYFQLFRERTLQGLYNKSKLVRGDRIKILKVIVEKTIENGNFRTSPWGIMLQLYGPRCAIHPDNNQLLQYNKLILDSLCDSGDLLVQDFAYRASSKALATISNFEEENRKHRDLTALQKALVWLTLALVFVGIAQIVTPYFNQN